MQLHTKHINNLRTYTPSKNKYIFLYRCRFNIVSSSDTIREILHLCIIQQRYSTYTKEVKPHDKTTSHKLEEVDLHYYHNIQFSARLLYTYTPYIPNFIYLYLFYLFFLYYLRYFITEFTFYILHPNIV